MSRKPMKDPLDLLDITSVLSDEEREIQSTVARFLADRVRPHIGEWFYGWSGFPGWPAVRRSAASASPSPTSAATRPACAPGPSATVATGS
ncbi:hypothetical protein GCM10010303_65270 [Streptomyces purpurascens]|nr:hypothetical protein GCM10010303_65270 [Streptomyces purpurascens]